MKRVFQSPGEPMTAAKVDFSFRVYWAKMTYQWNKERRTAVRRQVLTLTEAENFHHNLIEKRYTLPLEDVPEQTHSGASLKALLEVLAALDNLEESEKNRD
ncbi:MAG: hypothetical protein K8I82_01365 [Anaerolineae bacterium]|nr:hypothetical protein [Anaerolineae bacterium]